MVEVGIETVKQLLKESRFRKEFFEYKKEIDQWINNPDCECNVPLYNAILSQKDKLESYYDDEVIIIDPPIEDFENTQINNWQVINCHVDELEEILRNLPNGPKQIAVARYEDQITVVVNDPTFN